MNELTKKEVCLQNEAFAYYSGWGGVEFHYIDHGMEDYIYCKSGAFGGKKRYHKLKVYYDNNGFYIKLDGHKIPLDECIRIDSKPMMSL